MCAAGRIDEIDSLSAALLVAASGLDVVYFGPGLTPADLVAAAADSEADVVVLDAESDGIDFIVRTLSRDVELWLVGRGADRAIDSLGPRAVAAGSDDALVENINRIGGAPV
jgi:hypothetical protein